MTDKNVNLLMFVLGILAFFFSMSYIMENVENNNTAMVIFWTVITAGNFHTIFVYGKRLL